MSDRHDDIFDTLSETKRLVGDLETPAGEEFSLDAILAEFGQGAAEPAPKKENVPPSAPSVSPPQEPILPPQPETEEAPAEQRTEEPGKKRAKVLQFPRVLAAKGQESPAEEPEEVTEEVPEPPAKETAVQEQSVSLEDLMSRTVESVLEGSDDAILDEPVPLRERLGSWCQTLEERLRPLLHRRLSERPKHTEEEAAPEPEMEMAAKEAKRRCKRLYRQMLFSAVPLVLLVAFSVIDVGWPQLLPEVWFTNALVRCGISGGLLLLTCALAMGVWKEAVAALKRIQITCDVAAVLPVLAVLGDCIYSAATGDASYLPLAAPAAVLVWLCLAGQMCTASAQRDAYHLADLGGCPPYAVAVTAAGACKQQGKLQGLYNISRQIDPARRIQTLLLPLLVSVATVLSGVVCIGGDRMNEFFRVWSALLTASMPLGLPLSGTLPLRHFNRRLSRSGCAVAGYAGARAVSASRRMVVTDQDLFPPGTVSLNGMKIYGEEIGKVVAYAATVAKAADSPLQPIFDQLLASEGGTRRKLEDLHYYEEGGVGGTIRGETVIMGSAYFMKKMRVTLPRELKVKTGVFLAVDGQLIAIFAIKYQPSRNVEWALRTLRRSRIEPVLAVRSSNITPGLLKRKFNLDAKAVYPDVSTRLALSDLSKEQAERANAILYREGLMPFAETVVGSRRCCRMVKAATVLCWMGSLCGLLLGYYLAGVAAYDALNAGYLLVFLLLWLLPTILLADLTRRY